MSEPAFLKNLTEEHHAFSAAFQELSARAAREEPRALEGLFVLCDDFLIRHHERREETILFPLLRPDPRLKAGGPECSLHFDAFMNDRPLERAGRVCRREGLTPEPPRWNDGALDDQRAGSPLCIPAEDHEAGRLLMRVLLSRPPPQTRDDLERQLRLFGEFFRVQAWHHRREEGCFFRMCKELIPESTWEEIAGRDELWRPPLSRPGVSQVIEALARSGWTRVAA